MITETNQTYAHFLSSRCGKQWSRIGIQRRAGVAAPLFSLYSANSVGIGELPDLKLLVDWCRACGLSLIQLLPMNDVGFDFRPYDAQSSFALDPMYLSLSHLEETNLKPFQKEISTLRKKFPPGPPRVNYQVKAAKLDLLWKIYKKNAVQFPAGFDRYIDGNRFWLEDYALFKVLKEINEEKGWEEWPPEQKEKRMAALQEIHLNHVERINFYKWLQWQLYLQFKAVKLYAEERQVLIVGDLPFLVSRDSSDVWAHQDCFKLDCSSGAPPDLYFARGQRWGMPPYNWDAIAHHRYDYLVEKLRAAQNFYDFFRIDHFVGLFRLWTIPMSEPSENAGLHGTFDPREEHLWEEHGRRILTAMVENTRMLPCAEDLGVIPECSYRVLEEFGVPGIDVQRWTRDWNKTYAFKPPELYRKNSVANISTHDMSTLCGWWQYEAGTADEILFKRKCESRGVFFDAVKDRLFDLARSQHNRLRWKKEISSVGALLSILNLREEQARDFIDIYKSSFDEKEKFWGFLGLDGEPEAKCPPAFIRSVLEKINATASIFSVQLIQDWLSLGGVLPGDPWEWRINFPGSISEKNWAWVLPFPLEKLLTLPLNRTLQSLNASASRI